MTYQSTGHDAVIRQADGARIPFADGNTDYAHYLAWLAAGNTPDPAEPPPPPSIVTMRQARLALLHAGMLAQVNAAVASLPGVEGDAARIEWEFSSTVERDRPLVQALIGALGLNEAQLDALFVAAAAL